MASIEKLQKEISQFEARRDELTKKRNQAVERADSVEAARRTSVAEAIADGQPAPRESERQFEEILRLRQSVTDFDSGIAAVEKKLATVREELARTERQNAIELVKAQIAGLPSADGEVFTALTALRTATNSLFAAARAVASALNEFDTTRWGAAFAAHLELDIRQAIVREVSQFGLPVLTEQQPFASGIVTALRSAIAQLEFESFGGKIELQRGEVLYRVLSKISGVRDLVLMPGDVIGLTPAEAKRFIEVGSLELAKPGSKEAA